MWQEASKLLKNESKQKKSNGSYKKVAFNNQSWEDKKGIGNTINIRIVNKNCPKCYAIKKRKPTKKSQSQLLNSIETNWSACTIL